MSVSGENAMAAGDGVREGERTIPVLFDACGQFLSTPAGRGMDARNARCPIEGSLLR